jgi:hypothetical protein
MGVRRSIQAAAGATAALLALVVLPAGAAATRKGVTVPCTGQAALVAAINARNAAGGGTINLAAGCHYALTAAANGQNGLPVVTSRISVNGNGATIDGTGTVRVLEVDGPDGSLSLQNVTVTGGSADSGGGIANHGGAVTLNHTRVTGNAATQAGGGIASATFGPPSVAKLTLNNSVVSNNHQTAGPQDNGLGGGGIVNILGTVTLNRSQVNRNTAQGFVGGGIANGDYLNFSSASSFLTLNRSQVNDNTAPNAGGGGVQNLLGSVTLNRSQVNGNTSLNGGGISSGNGNGGIPPGTSHLVLNKSQVDGNTATAPAPQPGSPAGPPIAGGGIANGGEAVLNGSRVDSNIASHTSGAGIVNHGTMTLNKSEVNGNTAAGSGVVASGGGIINAQGPPGAAGSAILTLNHSRVNGNQAGGDGGGIANGVPLPGPIPLVGGPVTLNHSQVMGNTAAHGGGIFNSGGTVSLSATAVPGNTPDNCEPPNSIPGCTG